MGDKAEERHGEVTDLDRYRRERQRDVSLVLKRGVDRGDLRTMLLEWCMPLPVGGLSMIEVRHERSRVPLDRIAWSYEGDNKSDIDKVKERIAQKIERDAKHLANAKQDYVVEGMYAGNDFPSVHERFSAYWTENDDEEDSRLSRIDPKILHKQCAELGNVVVKLAKHMTTISLKREVSADAREAGLFTRLDTLQSKCETMFDAFQNALDRQQEREQKARNSQELIKGAREILETAKLYAPGLVYAYTGKKLLPIPDYAHPIVEQLMNLYSTVTTDPEAMNTLMFALKKNPKAWKAFGLVMSNIEDFRTLQKERARIAAEASEEERKEQAEAAAKEKAELDAEIEQSKREEEMTTPRVSVEKVERASSIPKTSPRPAATDYKGPFGLRLY